MLRTTFLKNGYSQSSLFKKVIISPVLQGHNSLRPLSILTWRSRNKSPSDKLCLKDILFRNVSSTSTGNSDTQEKKKNPEIILDDIGAEKKQAPAKVGRFKELWQNYGVVFIGIYGSLYFVALGTIYELVASKYLDAESALLYLHSMGLDRIMDVTPIATSKAGTFALAWILTKFTEPFRLATTVAITPTISRYLGRAPPKKSKSVHPE